MKSGNLNFLEPLGHFRPVTGLLYLFTLVRCVCLYMCVCVCVYMCVYVCVFCGINRNQTIKVREAGLKTTEQDKLNKVQCITELGTTQIKITCFHNNLCSKNSCYHSVQNILSSHCLSKKIEINIYRIILCLVFRMGVNLGLSH